MQAAFYEPPNQPTIKRMIRAYTTAHMKCRMQTQPAADSFPHSTHKKAACTSFFKVQAAFYWSPDITVCPAADSANPDADGAC
ncbi:MAG: hypothetical protein D8B47_02715, partial [Kingella sp. (in: b-proteobacteria)]